MQIDGRRLTAPQNPISKSPNTPVTHLLRLNGHGELVLHAVGQGRGGARHPVRHPVSRSPVGVRHPAIRGAAVCQQLTPRVRVDMGTTRSILSLLHQALQAHNT